MKEGLVEGSSQAKVQGVSASDRCQSSIPAFESIGMP